MWSPTAWISDILRKTNLSSHSDFGMSPRSCFFTSWNTQKTSVPHPPRAAGCLTFSNLPISSLIPDLLGVVVSTLPSASLPGHNNRRCFPLRSVLPIPNHSLTKPHLLYEAHHFLLNSRKVVPPTGVAARGPAISHTVKVIWELSGRSQ